MTCAGSLPSRSDPEQTPRLATYLDVWPEVDEILDPEGKLIQTYSSEREAQPNPPSIFMGGAGQKRLTRKAGMNRFVLDLRHPVVDVVPDAIVWAFTGGPRAVPGTYRATLEVGDWSESRSFRIVEDPRIQTASRTSRKLWISCSRCARASMRRTTRYVARGTSGARFASRPSHERSGSRRERARRVRRLTGVEAHRHRRRLDAAEERSRSGRRELSHQARQPGRLRVLAR